MNPALLFSIAGAVGIVWGGICAVFNDWAAGWGRRMQSLWGERAAARVTPGFVRIIGIGLIVIGIVFVVLAVTGVLPDRPV